MKKLQKIAVLGNNSGRNAGDMAILGNLLRDISEEIPELEYWIPTTNPKFIASHFKKFNVKPIGMMPWNGCLKNFGYPLYRAMTKTDLVLICDNILFDRKYYNPLFNNLSSIALFAPYCKKRRIPIMLYNASVGPIKSSVGKKAVQKILDATDLVVLRDHATKELFEQRNLRYPEVYIHADSAMNTLPPPRKRLEEIISKERLFTNSNGTIGFNVNAYINNWSKGGTFTRKDFCGSIAGAADQTIDRLEVDLIFFVTQVMDLKITRECVDRIKRKDKVKIIANTEYTYNEIAALIGRVELHSGLRTHTLIFAAAMSTPMIGITSYPKTTGFLRTIGQDDWQVPFDKLSADTLFEVIQKAWNERQKTSKKISKCIPQEKEKARLTAVLLKKYFYCSF
ncbi:Polysaccharide pyruvyl transferase domain-containing protein [Candidatus Electrothrix laxa]